MASRESRNVPRQNYNDINEILDIVLGDDSDAEYDVGEGNDIASDESDWEYEDEPRLEGENNIDPVVTTGPDGGVEPIEHLPAADNRHDTDDLSDFSDDSINTNEENPVPPAVNPPPPKRGRNRGGVRVRGGHARPRGNRGVRVRGGRLRRPRNNVNNDDLDNINNNNRNQNEVWTWNKIPEVENTEEETLPIFAEREGLRVRINENANVLDYVELYLTENILTHIVNETNRYAKQYFDENPEQSENSYLSKWHDTDIIEMKKFFGLVILMGIVYKPSLPLYWSTDELYYTPIFSKVMTRDRFYLLQKFLHFNNNLDPGYDPNDDERDRLHKVRPFIEMIQERCRKVYYPGKHLSVDESLVLFKGRLHFKQYIKTKRARFGIKLYELTSSDGITLDFLVYCGKGMFYNDDENSDMPTTERIPVALMRPYLDKGHILYTDNYYTSPSLATFLLENGTHLCGTIRTNRRYYAKDILKENLDKGTAAFYRANHDDRIIACKYRSIKDKAGNTPKVVFMLSTCHKSAMIEVNKDRDGNSVFKPVIVKSYNTHMGGVDRVDQQLHNIQSLRKSYKWYKKLALRLVMQVTLNAYKIFQSHTGNTDKTYQQFLHDTIVLVLSLTPDIPPVLDNHDTIERLSGRHFPSVKEQEGATPRPHKKCRVCRARGIKTPKGQPVKTVYICNFCPSKPGLHPDTCFQAYHTLLDYSKIE